jgi:hypothetical protein
LFFREKYFGGEKVVFAGGFGDFVVFLSGKNVVSLWWIGW